MAKTVRSVALHTYSRSENPHEYESTGFGRGFCAQKKALRPEDQRAVYVEKIPLTKQDPVIGAFRPRHNSRNRSAGFSQAPATLTVDDRKSICKRLHDHWATGKAQKAKFYVVSEKLRLEWNTGSQKQCLPKLPAAYARFLMHAILNTYSTVVQPPEYVCMSSNAHKLFCAIAI